MGKYEKALIAALRAFADTMEAELSADDQAVEGPPEGESAEPVTDLYWRERMVTVLGGIAEINDQGHPVSIAKAREICAKAEMSPRGLAGYHGAGFLEFRPPDERWITDVGRQRLAELRAELGDDQSGPAGR